MGRSSLPERAFDTANAESKALVEPRGSGCSTRGLRPLPSQSGSEKLDSTGGYVLKNVKPPETPVAPS